MISLQRQFGDKLLIVGVSEDDDVRECHEIRNAFENHYPIVMATQEVIAAYGGVPALPTTFVIDTQGRVVTEACRIASDRHIYPGIRSLFRQPVDARIETFETRASVFEKCGERHRITRRESHWMTPARRSGPASPDAKLHLRMPVDALECRVK